MNLDRYGIVFKRYQEETLEWTYFICSKRGRGRRRYSKQGECLCVLREMIRNICKRNVLEELYIPFDCFDAIWEEFNEYELNVSELICDDIDIKRDCYDGTGITFTYGGFFIPDDGKHSLFSKF